MKLDPTHRAEIVAWATDWVREKEDVFRSLSKRDARAESEKIWFEIHAKDGKCDTDVLCAMIDAAETDPLVFDALCWAGSERVRYGSRNQSIPPDLRHFLADVLIGERKQPAERPGPPSPDAYRDYWVFILVLQLTHTFGLHATRNDATESSDSACDITAEALCAAGLRPSSYGRVRKVWQHHKARANRIFSDSAG